MPDDNILPPTPILRWKVITKLEGKEAENFATLVSVCCYLLGIPMEGAVEIPERLVQPILQLTLAITADAEEAKGVTWFTPDDDAE